MIDLHVHSSVSDGTDAPDEIARLAAEAGCTAIALTDHDSLEGVWPAQRSCESRGVDFAPGCEISCEWSRGSLHVLVYFVEPGEGPLQDALVDLQRARLERNEAMARRLASMGLPVSYDEILAEAGGRGVGRPHAAAVLVRKGLVGSVQEAFDKWLAKGKPAHVDKARLAPDTAIRLARDSGGVPVMAHPHTLHVEPSELESAVSELASTGLGGLEAAYSEYSPDERERLSRVARRQNLAITGGSDYHGRYKPGLSIGTGRGDLSVPDEYLDRLRDAVK